MASVKIKVGNLKRASAKVKRIPSVVDVELQKQTLAAAKEVVDLAFAAILAPKSGRFYSKKYQRGGTLRWQASAPGEAPAKKSGRNIHKIRAMKFNRKERPGAKLKAPIIYKFLEQGLQRGNIAPRPLFGPILGKYRRQYKNRLDEAVRRILGLTIRK